MHCIVSFSAALLFLDDEQRARASGASCFKRTIYAVKVERRHIVSSLNDDGDFLIG